MTVEQIANRLVERCRKGEYETCHHELFAPDAESVEATGDTVKGLENIGKKAAQWCAEHDVHGGTVSDPIVADPFFALKMTIDVTHKSSGQRFTVDELCMTPSATGQSPANSFTTTVGSDSVRAIVTSRASGRRDERMSSACKRMNVVRERAERVLERVQRRPRACENRRELQVEYPTLDVPFNRIIVESWSRGRFRKRHGEFGEIGSQRERDFRRRMPAAIPGELVLKLFLVSKLFL